MSEQGRVDLERLRRAAKAGLACVSMAEMAALLAVVDAALAWEDDERGCEHRLIMALEPFTPAEVEAWPDPPRERIDGGAFNERMQERERARRLASAAGEPGREEPEHAESPFDEPWQRRARARRLAALGISVVDPPVSDGVSSGAGGRSESCARADGPQIPSGPAPLPARVEALVEALRYYAKPETYRQVGWCDDLFAVVEEDSGEKARAALAEWEQA